MRQSKAESLAGSSLRPLAPAMGASTALSECLEAHGSISQRRPVRRRVIGSLIGSAVQNASNCAPEGRRCRHLRRPGQNSRTAIPATNRPMRPSVTSALKASPRSLRAGAGSATRRRSLVAGAQPAPGFQCVKGHPSCGGSGADPCGSRRAIQWYTDRNSTWHSVSGCAR